MTNMIQGNTANRKQAKSRDNEIVRGWDHYYGIACKLAWRWHSEWFPTSDDLRQAAALAASVAFSELGDHTTMRDLVRLVSSELRRQAVAYGHRQLTITQPDGSKKKIHLNREVTYAQLESAQREQDDNSNLMEYLETRMMVVGVGEYTRKHAHFLHELLH